ncbi:competence protein CoiA family protein [Shewanella sp. 10N.286.52.B9]|uniref:competence protein CoiA family protein n=1 Tax=Shewanella sp. 10N.286.52.B9 TaxID=1880837 RepID=UPI000C86018E|nr:competence protein CoiA family protein [Shewanella sp. 10N.286.52.B9]PMG41026.1 hypothetical protein BCU91_11635 [Shewanella sp. 10N.286.52.B9]
MPKVKLKYGIRDDKLLHIFDVESGLACSCKCPSCGEPLVAKKGLKQENHFAHSSGHACRFAAETALHYSAKEILSSQMQVQLPPVYIDFNSNKERYKISNAKMFTIDSIKIEKGVDGFIPDLIANIGGRELLIEVCVTHAVDELKKRKVERFGCSTIEVDLSKAPRDMSIESLTDLIIHSVDNKKWIFNARSKYEAERMMSQARTMEVTQRGFASHIDYCPIKARVWHGKAYANLIDDCSCCTHCLDVDTFNGTIQCNGHVPENKLYKPKRFK